MKRGDRFVLDQDYNGCVLVTDGVSFFAEDKEHKVVAEARSLDAVKHKVLKPHKVDIDAVMLEDRWSYSDDEFEPKRVRIYAVSGAGALLYQGEDGKKDKDNYDSLRKWDDAKVAEFRRLKKAKAEATKGLEELLKTWPKIKAKALREEVEVTT